MKKKTIAIIVTLLFIVSVIACGSAPARVAGSNNSSNKKMELVSYYGDFEEYRDTETGVHYFVYTESTGYGKGCAITPRYNADGTLYVD